MRKLFLLFVSCIFFMIPAALKAQTIPLITTKMGRLTVDDGLSQGFVIGAIQDKDGYIWLATYDGLNRYDGNTVKVFRNDPDDPYSLPDNMVRQVVEDENGNLWVGTLNSGLLLFDRKKEKFYPVNLPFDSLDEKVHSIIYMSYTNKRLYIRLQNTFLVTDPGNIVPGKYDEQLLPQPLKIIFVLKNIPGVWAQWSYAQENYFWNFENGNAVLYSPDKDLKHWNETIFTPTELGIDSILPSLEFYKFPNEEKFFFLYHNIINVYDIKSKKNLLKKTLDFTETHNIRRPKVIDGKLYFADSEEGFFLYEMDLHTFQIKKYLGNENIRITDILFKDKTGVIWMGTDAQGMFLFNRQINMFHKINTGNHFVNGTFSMLFYRDQDILEYSTQTGLTKTIIAEKDYNVKKPILFQFVDHKGNYWCTNGERLFTEYNPQTKKTIEVKTDNKSNIFLFEDRLKYLWVLRFGLNDNSIYLSKTENSMSKVISEFKFPVLLPYTETRFINGEYQDSKGIFWFATISGLFRFDPAATDKNKIWKQWKNIRGDNTSPAQDHLMCILPDPKQPEKFLWLGTKGSGFDRFEIATGKFIHFSEKDGLPNNVAYMILPDEFGNLWISTNKGLSCFTPPTDNNSTGHFRNFTEADGLPGNEFNTFGGKKLPSGELFFDAVKGTTWFRPSEVLKQQLPMPVQFTSLTINNNDINWKEDTTALSAPVNYARTITLNPHENIFSIHFESMDFRNKSNKLYKYYLEGFDKTWLNPSLKNEATYTNLDPGTYVFHVIGTNCDGVWNTDGNYINIVVLAAWYQTMIFKIFVFLVFAGVLYGFYRYRLKQTLKLYSVRNRIAADLHDEIGSTLSSISLSSSVIQKKINNNTTEVDSMLQQISTNTDNMMEAMSDIVWAVNTKNDRFDNVVNRMRAFAIEILEPKNITLHENISLNVETITLDMQQRKNLYLIFKEAINNAAKYSCCQNVWIDISINGSKELSLKIKDDGKGFELINNRIEDGNQIFGGNGISNMRKRGNDLKGTVTVNSELTKGTEVILRFRI